MPATAKVRRSQLNQSFERNGFHIVTMPLKLSGYKTEAGGEKYIFVNSKLPKQRRADVVAALMRSH